MITERHRLKLATIGELGASLGISCKVLSYRIARGQFPGPTHTVGNGTRRYYTPEEATKLVRVYGRSPGGSPEEAAELVRVYGQISETCQK